MRHLLIISFWLVTSAVSAQTNPKLLKELDSYIEHQRKAWNIPGMAVAIVKDGEIIHAKGYGVRDTKANAPVTPNTLFAIASNSKAFTTAALSILIDEGKLSWSDKVVSHLPWFKLYSPFVTEEMTVLDLVSHRSGLATFSGDLLWYGTTHSREEVVRRARHLKPAHGFREKFGYQNVMFVAAGLIVEKVSAQSWDEFIAIRFFGPLGMKNSTTSVNELMRFNEVALPHNEVEGQNQVIKWVNWDNMAPAGSILSSVNDVARWLLLQLGQGTLDEKTYWSSARSREMNTMITPTGIGSFSKTHMPSKHFNGYGLGWNVFDFHGKQVMAHGGGYDGMISQTFFVPEVNLGGVILTNNNNWLPGMLMHSILDKLLTGRPGPDYGSMLLERKKEDDRETAAKLRVFDERVEKSVAVRPLSEYAGTYECPMYGRLLVWEDDTKLRFQFEQTPLFGGMLFNAGHDTFVMRWKEQMMLPPGLMQFVSDFNGKPFEIRIEVENPDFDFGELGFKKLPSRD
jgi:CubicO group peptidase (beta-lactamase class C family)